MGKGSLAVIVEPLEGVHHFGRLLLREETKDAREKFSDGRLSGYDDPVMLPPFPCILGCELYEVVDIVRQERPLMFDGVFQDLGVVRFTQTLRNDSDDVKTPFAEHFGQKGTDILIEQKTNRGH